MNHVTTLNRAGITLPAGDDPYAEVAAEGGGQFGKLLKFAKGEWTHNDTTIEIGTEFLAIVGEAMRGDVRFQDGRPVEQRIGYIRDRAKFARRADLGFDDQTLWERDKTGKPIDPWSPQTFLPMIHKESGELYCYIFRSAGAKQTFRNLCSEYSPYRTTSMLPVISLQADRYRHSDFGWIDIPILRVERWDDSGDHTSIAPDEKAGANAKVIGQARAATRDRDADDMNDDIPF